MFFVRQGATHKLLIGPVVAVGDGFTPVTTLALGTADEAEAILHDNGTVVDISAYTFAAITTADGYYHLTLQSGITNTVGHTTIVINDDSLCLPVRVDYTVVEEAVYDQFYAASAPGAATVAALSTVDGIVDDILVDTGTTLPATLATIDGIVDDILVDTGTSGVLVSSGTGTGQINLSAGIADVNAVQLSGSGPAANNAELFFDGTGYAGGTTPLNVNVTAAAANTINASALATDAVTEIVDAMKAAVIETEGSYTLQQAMSIMLAVLAGVTTSAGNTLQTPNGIATRVAATTNASNERTAVTITPSS